ncbi:MAG: hypothetical protein KGJ55_09910 [Gammaproteobacteria bacterium]|nr:hypothetical protein [Gammaproteobacteria bacterium]
MGLFNDIAAKIAAMRQHSKDKKAFFQSLFAAAEHGKLTDEEIQHIHSRQAELNLTDKDLKSIRVQAYNVALHAARNDGKVTAEEETELQKLQQALNISDVEIATSKQELARLRLLAEIQDGNLPVIGVQDVLLQKGETAHWIEAGNILEERVVNRRFVGGSQGMSFRIAKGVSYRVGSYRGHLVADKAVVPVSAGELILTNKRVIFRGDAKSFNIRLDKLLELHFYTDGVRLTDGSGKPRIVKFSSSGNTDIVGAILSGAINRYAA